MDSVQRLVMKSKKCKSKNYENSTHKNRVFEVLQSSRNKNDSFCDIKLQTDDGTIVIGHKSILASATPYFKTMFFSVGESNKDLVKITKLDSTILKLLIDYIYSGEIMIAQENVQFVLVAADLLQLYYVEQVCVEFLQKQLDPSNCLGIKEFANLHNFKKLLSNCEAFIKKQFLEIVKYDEFLSLSSEEVIKLISCNDINVPFEEKVYECVIKWVKHELNQRKHLLPNLMEHVRLPLVSKEYLLENVVDEPLLKNDPKCKDYVFKSLHFNLIKSVNSFSIPKTVWSKPRQVQKIFLISSGSKSEKKYITNWYDPATNQLQIVPEITYCNQSSILCVVKDEFVFLVCGETRCAGMTDISLQEVFSLDTQKWKIVSNKYSKSERRKFSVGVLNNLIYTVGGVNGSTYLKSIECYDPSLDKWSPVVEMAIKRCNVGVGVLNGIMYVVSGVSKLGIHKCVEAYSPSDGVWTSIANMHLCRENPGVLALYGLLYVIGGNFSNSIEIYNPITKSWSMKTVSISDPIYGAVIVNKPLHLIIN
ncbi:hypothetical protein AGLY_010157 [Aphis glycines]|uniref:Kelch-like protein diablo n=1 Tax=Aphis glycines TaxID=307491 RepID=A0A6G0TFL2_APHGL|nr:hypothetical protein AGLY_010157 [Aphis glycines]